AHNGAESAETRNLLGQFLSDRRTFDYAPRYRDILIRALSEAWGDPRSLVSTSVHAVAGNAAVAESMNRAIEAWPARLPAASFFGSFGLDAIANDSLLRFLLAYERIASVEFEKFLSGLRSALLEKATDGEREQYPSAVLSLYASLAQQ